MVSFLYSQKHVYTSIGTGLVSARIADAGRIVELGIFARILGSRYLLFKMPNATTLF
jgi:hypothetical protein